MKTEVDQILRAFVEIMEGLPSLRADPSLSAWSWLWQSYADWDAAAICLSVMTRNTHCSSETLSRACSATEYFFDSRADCLFEPSRQEQWRHLNHLRAQVEVPRSFATKEKKRRKSKASSTKEEPPSQTQTRPVANERRAVTLPVEFSAFCDDGTRHRRSQLSSGDRNWSMPVCQKVDEMLFDLEALDLHNHNVKIGE